MKIALFGATGRTGNRVLTRALDSGHEVAALVRNPQKLAHGSGNLTVSTGDMTVHADVEPVIRDAAAVIMAAGPVKGSPAGMLENAAQTIVAAMKESGVSRLVWLTGAGVVDERDARAPSRTLVRAAMILVAGKVLRSSEAAYEIIRTSGLDYTVVRPPMLADEPGGVDLAGSYTPPKPIPVGRDDLAAFLLNAAVSGEWIGESPFLSYAQRRR